MKASLTVRCGLATDRLPEVLDLELVAVAPRALERLDRAVAAPYRHALWGLVRVPGGGHVQDAVAADHGEAVVERRAQGHVEQSRDAGWEAQHPVGALVDTASGEDLAGHRLDRLLTRNETREADAIAAEVAAAPRRRDRTSGGCRSRGRPP